MYLKKLKLKNFRNYKTAELDFKKAKTIIIGKNAQGKTNILEAVYYLSMFASNRTKSDDELVRWDGDLAIINSVAEKNEVDISMDISIDKNAKKSLKFNDIKKTKLSDYVGYISAVNFSTDDLMLLRGSPSDRRNYFDEAVAKIYPMYRKRLQRFNKAREQRNNFLKKAQHNQNFGEMLNVWDEQIVVSGSNIIFLRHKYLKEIEKSATDKHKAISNGEGLRLEYFSTVADDFSSAEEIANAYRAKLKEIREEEISRRQTLAGPHRDDFEFFINDINAKKYASQGQQRTIVLSLKLAELDFIHRISGEHPILLLDDVLAELDSFRQNYLLSAIEKTTQTIITTVDTSHFPEEYLRDVEVYRIENGEIV